MQSVEEAVTPPKYDLEELLKSPRRPLTEEEFDNFDRYMRFSNDDKPASEVDIDDAVDYIVKKIDENGICWW
jgi:hypothetical protein